MTGRVIVLDYAAKLPLSWLAVGNHVGRLAEDGFVFDTSGTGFEMRVGPVGQTLLRAYRQSVGAMARAGLNVIVDDVMLRQEEWDNWQQAVDGCTGSRAT